MTLMNKFANLTPEQREKFAEAKNTAALDAFASEHGIELTDEEKQDTLEYIKTGVLPLSDDELDAAAGGWTPAPWHYHKVEIEGPFCGCGTNTARAMKKTCTDHGSYTRTVYEDCICTVCLARSPEFVYEFQKSGR